MRFHENLKRICNEQGTNPTNVLKELGLSTSKVAAWNKGNLPKQETMVRLAEQLHCSVMDFFADDEDLKQRDLSLNEDEQEIIRIFRILDRRAKHEFMALAYQFEKSNNVEYSLAAKNGDGVTMLYDKDQQKAVDSFIDEVVKDAKG